MCKVSSAGVRLDRLPVSRFHYRLLALIGSGLFLDALDIYIQGPLLAYFLSTGWSNIHQNADFLSATFLGLVFGTILSGPLSDRFGRRAMYQVNLLVFGIASIVAAFAPSHETLVLCRLVIGVGLGGEVVVAYGMLSEFVPPTVRGIWQGRLALLSNLGIPVSALLCAVMLPIFGWRFVLGLIGVLAGFVWVFRRSMPESPRWYEAVDRHKEAETALKAIEREVERSTGSPLPSVPPQTPLAPPANKAGIRTLFQGHLLRRTLLAVFLMVCANIVVYTLTGWLPTVLLQESFAMDSTLHMTWLMQLGALPGAVAGSWAADRLGRRHGIAVASLAAALAAIASGFARNSVESVITGFAVFLCAYALATMTFAIYVPEIFPTAVRMTGSSFANACGRIANVAVPQTVPWMLARFGPLSIFFGVSVVLCFQAVVVWAFGESTELRSLEQISCQDSGPASTHDKSRAPEQSSDAAPPDVS